MERYDMNMRRGISRLGRRDFLYGLGSSIGSVALTGMLASEAAGAAGVNSTPGAGPLAVKAPMLPTGIKRCVFLMMEGGPSHIDTFDPKPQLEKIHMKTKFIEKNKFQSAMSSGNRYYVKSPFKSRKVGQAGIDMSAPWVHLADVADELCMYRGCQAESVNHPTACYHINTGNKFGGDPAIGSWVTYGLGSVNQNLPGFVVLPESAFPQGGAANWSNGYLPAHYQGTTLRSSGSPILDLKPPAGVTRAQQRKNLDLLGELNREHMAGHAEHGDLAARIESYELAFRMQMQVPDIIDLNQESESTRTMYGIGETETHDFGRRCLLARRLLEQGVRFVQVYTGGWDSHDYIERAHASRIKSVDKPIAALIKDLRQRGMLDETLIVWTGEFGRSPDNGNRGGGAVIGRDHNATAMPMWFAGGGVKAGHIIGATDEIGEKAVEVVNPIKNVHVTILRMMGLDDNKLTYFHGGRFKQLSQTGGEVIEELLA